MKRRAQSGFTLIEILVVAALLALLSGIAVINIQRAYVDNQRKATYGEARSLATALSFAYEDIGLYPKLCFLRHNDIFIAPPSASALNQPGLRLVSGFDYIGYEVNNSPTLIKRVIDNWAKGLGSPGYFSAAEGKKGMFQGRRGGLVGMEIPIDIYTPKIVGPGQALPIYDWPADSWGRPYVVYMLYQEGVDQNGRPIVRFVDKSSRAPNFALCVVSYGPNRIPGGRADQLTPVELSSGEQNALYGRVDRQYPDQSDFRALRPSEYTQNRVEAYSHVRILGEDPKTLTYTGVIDPGSDDIVVDFY